VKIGTETIDGRKVAIEVDSQSGKFSGVVDGDAYSADTLDALRAKIRSAFRKEAIRLAIPVTMLDVELHKPDYGRPTGRSASGAVRHMTITGVYGRTGNVLVKWDDTGESEQLSHYGGDIVRRLTENEIRDYAALSKAASEATSARMKFVDARKIGTYRYDVKKFVEQKVKEMVDDPKENPTDVGDADPRTGGARAARRRR
jgi:hypothetical protein